MNKVVKQLLWLAVLVCIGMLVSTLVSVCLMSVNSSINMQKCSQILISVCTFLLPAVLMPIITKSKQEFDFGYYKVSWLTWIIAAVILVVAFPAANFFKWQNDMLSLPESMRDIELWMQHMEQQATELTEQFLAVNSVGGLLFNLVVLAFVPAVCEEFFFRGALQTLFCKSMNSHVAVWVTAFVFSAIHMQFYGFLPRLLLGAVLGYLFLYSGSIWVSTLAHFVNNALAVVVAFLTQKYAMCANFETLGTEQTWYWGILSTIVVVGLLVYFPKKTIEK